MTRVRPFLPLAPVRFSAVAVPEPCEPRTRALILMMKIPAEEIVAALGLGEDGLAIFLTWFATRHPYSAAAIVAVFLLIIGLLARWVLRSLRALFRGAEEVVAG